MIQLFVCEDKNVIKRCISKGWKFADFSITGMTYSDVDLPHDYSISKPRNSSGDMLNGYFQVTNGQYLKFIKLDGNKHYVLDVDGAYSCAEVSFNEELLFLHPHGYTPFLVDLTDYVIPEIENKIKITTNPLPHSTRWYHGCGLYRDVFLWEGGEVRIEPWDMFVYSENVSAGSADVVMKFTVSSDIDASVSVKFEISKRGGAPVVRDGISLSTPCGKSEYRHVITLDNPALWDVDNPNLYMLKTEIYKGEELLDTTLTDFGIRSITATAEDGLLFNGKPLKLRGGCIHHDHGVLGAAAYPAAEERKIRKLKEAGFNSVRIAHNPPSLALLEVCDRLGMIVQDEAFDIWSKRKLDVTADYHIFFKEWWDRDISYMVRRDRNHPSVMSYSIGNEIYEIDMTSEGAEWSKKLSDEIRKYDDTKFVTSAVQKITLANYKPDDVDTEEYRRYMEERFGAKDQHRINEATRAFEAPLDILGLNYHHDCLDVFHADNPDKVVWGSENWTLTIYRDWQNVLNNSYMIGDFTWTAIDNLGEVGHGASWWERDKDTFQKEAYPWRTCYQGDLDLCGYRLPLSHYREAVWLESKEPKTFVTHPEHYGEKYFGTPWSWEDVHDSWTFGKEYVGKPISVVTYGIYDKVEWFVNGRKVGEAVPREARATLDTVYEPGELLTVAYKGGKEFARQTIKTIGAPSAVLVKAEAESFTADRRDLCYFNISIVDKDGCVDVHSECEIAVNVSGAELLGVFSGNPISDDKFYENTCHVYKGRALAVLRSDTPGKVTITVCSENLRDGKAEVLAK